MMYTGRTLGAQRRGIRGQKDNFLPNSGKISTSSHWDAHRASENGKDCQTHSFFRHQ